MQHPQADARNNLLLVLGLLFIMASFHDYYGVLKTKGEFGLIDFVLFVTGLNLLVAKWVCQKKTKPFFLLVSAIVPTLLPIETANFPYNLKVAYLLLLLSPSLHIMLVKKRGILRFLNKVSDKLECASWRGIQIFKKIENRLVPIVFLGIILTARYLLTSKIDISQGPDFWWHYINTKTIYETGWPVYDPAIFDEKFLVYPFFSHLIAAILTYLSGWPIIKVITWLIYAAVLLTAAGVYLLVRTSYSRWCALIVMAAFIFLYVPQGELPKGRLAQPFGTLFGIFSLLFFVRYERSLKKKYGTASAIMAGLAFSSHWAMGLIVAIAYFLHILTTHGAKKILYFFSVFTLLSVPYLIFIFENSAVFSNAKPLVEGNFKEMLVAGQYFNSIGDIINNLTERLTLIGLVIAGIGVVSSLDNAKKRVVLSFLITSGLVLIGGYYYPFVYFLRFFDYIVLFLIVFIGDGINKIVETVSQSKRKNLVILSVSLFFLVFLVYLPIHAQNNINVDTRPISVPDASAVLWVRENLVREDPVSANLKITRFVYSFTSTKPNPPNKFAQFLNEAYNNKTSLYGGFLIINQWCGIQNNQVITPDLEGETPNFVLLRDVPCKEVSEIIEKKYLLVFKQDDSKIFRVK